MELYLEEISALEKKYSDICKPLYKERQNVATVRLDDDIKRINREGGEKKEGEVLKGDGSSGDDAGEGEER